MRKAIREALASGLRARLARASSSAGCSTRSPSATPSSCRRAWSSRNSARSGRRSSASRRRPARASPTRTRPRRRRAPNTADRRAPRAARPACWRRSASKADVKITDEEMTSALIERARAFPGQEQEVWDYLPQQSAGARRAARADLRGEGGRPHPRPGQGRGPQGDARGIVEAGGRRGADGRRRPRGRPAAPEPLAAEAPTASPFSRGSARRLCCGRQPDRFSIEKRDPCAISSTITTTTSCRW